MDVGPNMQCTKDPATARQYNRLDTLYCGKA